MLDANYYNWKSRRFFELDFDVADRIGKTGRAIGQEFLQPIIGNYDDADIDLGFLQAVPQMNDVTNQEVAPR